MFSLKGFLLPASCQNFCKATLCFYWSFPRAVGNMPENIYKSVGRIFNCTPLWNWEEVPIMMTLILILKGILKEKLRWISSLINSRMREHFINQSVKVLPQISGLRIWCPSREFDHEINLKVLLFLVLLDWRILKEIFEKLQF